MLDKVRSARRHRDAGHLELRIEVDGGIAADTIAEAAEAGADTFVAGTAVFDAPRPGRRPCDACAPWPRGRPRRREGDMA